MKTKMGLDFTSHSVTWYCACTMHNLPLKWPINIMLIIYLAPDQMRHTKFGM